MARGGFPRALPGCGEEPWRKTCRPRDTGSPAMGLMAQKRDY